MHFISVQQHQVILTFDERENIRVLILQPIYIRRVKSRFPYMAVVDGERTDLNKQPSSQKYTSVLDNPHFT